MSFHKTIKNPHDQLFKATFSLASEAEAFIKKFLPKWLSEGIDFDTFENISGAFTDEELEETLSDIVYKANWKNDEGGIQISFLYEHKSQGKPLDVYQLKGYVDRGYERQQRNKEAFHPIIPVIIHHDKTPWVKRNFHDLFELPDDNLRKYIPYFAYEVVDLYQITDEFLEDIPGSIFLRSTFLMFKHKKENQFIVDNIEEIFIFVEDVELDKDLKEFFIKAFLNYIFAAFRFPSQKIKSQIIKKLPKMAFDIAGTTYEVILEEGERKGMEKGIEKGLEKGVKKGKCLSDYKGIMKTFIKYPNHTLQQTADFYEMDVKKIKKLKTILAFPSFDKMNKGILSLFFLNIELNEEEKKEVLEIAKTYRKQITRN